MHGERERGCSFIRLEADVINRSNFQRREGSVRRLFQKRKFSGKKCTSSGRVYKSVLKSRIVHQKNYIHKEVHFFQEDLFEFWFLEQPSDYT